MKRGVWIGVWVLVGALSILWAVQLFGSGSSITGNVVSDSRTGLDCVVGKIGIVIEEDDAGNYEKVIYSLKTSEGEAYELDINEIKERVALNIISDTEVEVCGSSKREIFSVRDLRLVSGKGRGEPIGDVTGEQRIAFVLINFQDDQSEPLSVTGARNLMEDVNQFYQELSYGKTWLNTSVYGYFTLDGFSYICDPNQWQENVLNNTGIGPLPYPDHISNWHDYDRLILAFPETSCGWTGRGTIGKKTEQTIQGDVQISTIWLDGYEGWDFNTTSHELGHNHGVYHSGDWECGNETYGDGYPYYCQSIEYGDAYSVMGRSANANSLFMDNTHREMIGWLDEFDIGRVDKSNLGFHNLRPVQGDSSLHTGIKIPRVNRFGEPDGYYYLEYRRPLGVDSEVNVSLFNGIFVRIDEWRWGSGGGADVHLLDMSPHENSEVGQITDSNDPILKLGEGYKTFNDDYVIYPLQLHDNFATVLISSDPCYDTDSTGDFPDGRNHFEGGRVFDEMRVAKDRCTSVIPLPTQSGVYQRPVPFMSPEFPSDRQVRPELEEHQYVEPVLEEYYCDGGVWHKEYKDCEDYGSEYECINAACVVPGVCNDTDADGAHPGGLNYLEAGIMSHEGKLGRDSCRPEGTLGEYYCDGNQGAYEIKDCTDLGAGFYCNEGLCTDCTDTDGGVEYEERGTVTSSGEDYTDYCLGGNVLLEYYCDGLDVGNVTYDCSDLALDCWNGRCTTPE